MAEQQDELAGLVERVAVGGRDDVHDAGAAAVRLRAAETFHVHVFAGDAAHHVRAGHKDAALLRQDDQVGQRRPVGRAARGRAEHYRDLRDFARCPRHGGEHHADGVQALDAFQDPRSAGVPQADDRRADLERMRIGRDDRLAAGDPHGAALDARVAGEGHGGDAADGARSRHNAAVVLGQQQLERARVKQRFQARLRVATRPGVRGRPARRRRWRGDGHPTVLGTGTHLRRRP